MIQFLIILICLAALITEFFSVMWGWVILGVPMVFLLLLFFGLKQKKWRHIPGLSEEANQMLQKFGYYYAMPFTGRDFSASASTIMFAGIVVAIIGIFKGFWWGIGIAILNWLVMGLVARAFNPTNFLVDPIKQMAHKEIISYIMEKQKSKNSPKS